MRRPCARGYAVDLRRRSRRGTRGCSDRNGGEPPAVAGEVLHVLKEAAMRTLGGGIVRYVGAQLLPCPEDPVRVGQVIGPARMDIVCHGRVSESFCLGGGDDLLVPDGAEVGPGTRLIAEMSWERILRAPIPDDIEA